MSSAPGRPASVRHGRKIEPCRLCIVVPCVLALFSVVAGAGRAEAQEPPLSGLRYSAAAGCPSVTTFRGLVESKLSSAHHGELPTTFEVTIDKDHLGKLTFKDADGQLVQRRLRGANCPETSRAMALIVALAIDAWTAKKIASSPSEATAAPALVEGTAAPAPATAAGQATRAAEPTAAAASVAPVPAAPSVAPLRERPSPVTAAVKGAPEAGQPQASGPGFVSQRSSGAPARFAPFASLFQEGRGLDIGAHVVAGSGMAPELSFGPALSIGVRDYKQHWTARLSGHLIVSQATTQPEQGVAQGTTVTASYQRFAVQVDVCPQTVSWEFVLIDPCLFVELGQLRVEAVPDPGLEITPLDPVHDLWASLGGLIRANLRLTRQWYFEVQGGVELPLNRRIFVLDVAQNSPVDANSTDPDAVPVIYTVPRIGFNAGLGLHVFVQ